MSVHAAGAHPLPDEREQVAGACRRLAASGMVPGTAGNVSVRVGDQVAITPTGASLGNLSAELVSVVNLDGQLVGGTLHPTSEVELHLGILRRHEAGAVVHTHAPASTAVACVMDELPCIHYQMLALGGSVRVAPYATFGTPELAANVLQAMEGRTAALMANHGAVTYASTLDKAFEAMEVLEWVCDVYQRARIIGEPRVMTDAQLEKVIMHALEKQYGTPRPASPGGPGR